MRLTEHFTLEELTQSEIAARYGLDNRPTESVLQNLRVLAEGLERVRTVLAVPVLPSSGYRSPAVNVAVGGSIEPPSQHLKGEACDFIAPAFGNPKEVAKELLRHADTIKYDQLILEYGAWVHISFSPQNRREALTYMRGATGKPIKLQGII